MKIWKSFKKLQFQTFSTRFLILFNSFELKLVLFLPLQSQTNVNFHDFKSHRHFSLSKSMITISSSVKVLLLLRDICNEKVLVFPIKTLNENEKSSIKVIPQIPTTFHEVFYSVLIIFHSFLCTGFPVFSSFRHSNWPVDISKEVGRGKKNVDFNYWARDSVVESTWNNL